MYIHFVKMQHQKINPFLVGATGIFETMYKGVHHAHTVCSYLTDVLYDVNLLICLFCIDPSSAALSKTISN